MLFQKLNPLAFFFALGIGLAFVYMFAPRPRKVIKFPTPVNAGKIIYKGKDDDCFVYKANKVECTADAVTAASAAEDPAAEERD
nr:hypothetical protein TetV2_00512 [Oceanusvirus sp.]